MMLPLWIQILQALALLAISAVGACLAWQQVRIADAKLAHDLFDRRFKVYDATRRMLVEVGRTRNASNEVIDAFTVNTAEAIFLFDDDLAKYLNEEMYEHIIELPNKNYIIKSKPEVCP
jgi:hypothetical protein